MKMVSLIVSAVFRSLRLLRMCLRACSDVNASALAVRTRANNNQVLCATVARRVLVCDTKKLFQNSARIFVAFANPIR